MAKVYYQKVKEGDPIAVSLPVDFITAWVGEEQYTQEHIDAGLTEMLEQEDFDLALVNNEVILAAWIAEHIAPPGE